MPDVIVFNNPATGIAKIIVPAYADPTRPLQDTDNALVTRARAKSVPLGVPFVVVPSQSIFSDRTFREAWSLTGNVLVVDMPKARVLHMNNIRKARDQELVKLDIPFLQALERQDLIEQQRIARMKQTLRDIPTTFNLEGATTPDSLKAAWPSELPPRVPL